MKGEDVKDEVSQTALEDNPWVIRLGQLGFVAKGTVYILVGALALQAAVGTGDADGSPRGALHYIVGLPFGQILLIVIAIGLACYALWRVTEAWMDPDGKGSDIKGYIVRGGFAGIAFIYFGLAFSAFKIVLGARNDSGFWARSWTAWLLAQPFGQWLVALIGAIVTISGIYFFYQACSANFRENLRFKQMSETQAIWGTRFGRCGFAARGVVFCVIGIFIAYAAFYSDAGATRDFGAALRFIEQQSFGAWLLGTVAIGLFFYGVFMLFLAEFRRMVSG